MVRAVVPQQRCRRLIFVIEIGELSRELARHPRLGYGCLVNFYIMPTLYCTD